MTLKLIEQREEKEHHERKASRERHDVVLGALVRLGNEQRRLEDQHAAHMLLLNSLRVDIVPPRAVAAAANHTAVNLRYVELHE